MTGKLLATARFGMAWIFLWPFLDKTFGLGFATASEDAWIRGGSPTNGFLRFGSDPNGPLHGLFTAIAGHPVTNVLFMVGLLAIGVALALGIGMRIACASGAVMLVLMWIAILPMDSGTDHNPLWDDHIMYAVFMGVLWATNAGQTWGLADRWQAIPAVASRPWLW